ncbi:MAG TPA: hypothetical protein EYQ50_01450 [Verrucomicrobiales bacterium]|nr:hypothetical protein [Verrucomicrobiales bacterium]HIL68337.1 hypothetical protein [Verrucomicrobiota bacterium]
MKKNVSGFNTPIGIGIIALTLIFQGCSSSGPNTKRGAVGGGALGAIVGGIIGHQSGRGLEGAAIGAGVGAVGGGVLGNAKDQENENK